MAKNSRTPTNNPLSYRYLFFGGKGGVGKTTAATATALLLLEKAKPKETLLLFSTDPAHSLSDSIGKRIGDKPVEIAKHSGARLIAYEMDANAALERFRAKHGRLLAEIAERGTFLDEADINDLLNLSLPGLDEVMSLFELSELYRGKNYDRIIVDTAPSGHTTRLLRLPEVFRRMVRALDHMSDKHRYIMAHFARRRPAPDDVDRFLDDLNDRIERVRDMLQNKQHTSFTLVAIPEALSVEETQRYLETLRTENIPVTDLIVNRVETEHAGCLYCRSRVVTQRPWLAELSKRFSGIEVHYVPLFSEEVRGVPALQEFGKLIWSNGRLPKSAVRAVPQSLAALARTQSEGSFQFPDREIFIFGGKGGVGKTTAAASFALALARSNQHRRVLIFSTDPAHSLSDSFDEPIGDLKKCVANVTNLDCMEIDPGKWFEDLKQRYRSWTDELFASLGAGSKLEIKFDREAMRELVELTPPGIDEIAALGSVSDLLDQKKYDTIVLDTAPTGHLIRFLELPEIALAWVRTFIKLLLKYQSIVHATRIAEELVALSKSIKRVLALLTDTKRCEFIGVAIPERMSLEETKDLGESLKRLHVPLQRLLINGVVPEEPTRDCKFCRTRRLQQLQNVTRFKQQFDDTELFLAPQQPQAVQGPDDLKVHFESWQPLVGRTSRAKAPPQLRSRGPTVKNVRKAKR